MQIKSFNSIRVEKHFLSKTMSTSIKTIFTCSHCDAQTQKWAGQCFECGTWGTIVEQSTPPPSAQSITHLVAGTVATSIPLSSIHTSSHQSYKTHIKEFDRVLGGGITAGAVMLLSGEPGIGKSTLILQIAHALATPQTPVLYISGEESGGQVAKRLERLGLKNPSILFCEETRVENIIATLIHQKPFCAIIDSIQTIRSPQSDATAGSISQVRTATAMLTQCAKQTNIPLFLIGHVNKEGGVAGPKTLEHLIDAVFMIEGERSGELRIIRSLKNRFGPVDEIGMFVMNEQGMQEVTNPSALMIEERSSITPGSVITAMMEGTRPLLVEVQALVTKTSFGYPQRRVAGFDLNRLQILIAVLTQRMSLPLESYDVCLNISGGYTIKERAADLAVAMAIVSAHFDKPISKNIIALGEIGLNGEVRSIPHIEKRLKEAGRLGCSYALIPKKHAKLSSSIKVAEIENVSQLVEKLSGM